jgi:hypothetical protein
MEDKRLSLKEAQKAQKWVDLLALQYVRIIHFWEDFAADDADDADFLEQKETKATKKKSPFVSFVSCC